MKKLILTIYVVLGFIAACNTPKEAVSSKTQPTVQKSPFSLSVVPETSRGQGFGSSIDMAHNKPRDFYAVLTNVSAEPQASCQVLHPKGLVSYKIMLDKLVILCVYSLP
jgi:hypothetical protein